nr:hypothetical protein [Roseobacter litoralis]
MLACVRFKVDVDLPLAIGNHRPLMHKPLLQHAGTSTRTLHLIHQPGFQNASAYSAQHIILGFALDHDRINPAAMQQLTEQ